MNAETTPPVKHAGLPWLAAVLVALAALAVCAWLWQQQRRDVERDAALARALQQVQGRASALAGEIGALRARVRAHDDRLAEFGERLAGFRAALEQAQQNQGNVDLALAEVEYLLILAEQQLALLRDPDTAAAALEAVRRRLAALDAPGLDAVRGQVEVDLMRLAEVPRVDFSGWHAELGALGAAAGTLPLRPGPARAAAETAPAPGGWRGLLRAVWHELRGLVTITRDSESLRPLAAERSTLVQTLQLRIETARLALLRRDRAALREAAAAAADWLARWFDPADTGVREARALLARLQQVDPAPELPGIESSLETLRALLRERAAPLPPEPEAAP